MNNQQYPAQQQYRPTLLDVPISYFKYDHQRGNFTNEPAQQTTLRRIGSTKYYRPVIEPIRAETDPIRQAELKKQIPAITPVALLHHRKRDTPFAERISQQWPLMMGDIDKKDNPGVNMAELKTHLARLRYVLFCGYSVRGGLWFVVRLPDHQTPESLAAHFRYLRKVFSQIFGVALDSTKGGNPTDLRFVSYDVDPYINENATVMAGTYTPAKPVPRPLNQSRFSRQDEGELLPRLVRFTQNAGEGQRHATLLKAAKLAGGFVAAGRIDEQTAVYALETVASEWPMFSKSQKTIRDGIRYGLQKPLYPTGGPADTSWSSIGERRKSQRRSEPRPVIVPTEPMPDKWEMPRPRWILNGRTIYGDVLITDQSTTDDYPAEWDEPNSPDARPAILPIMLADYPPPPRKPS
ncbi:hypothetical protein GCM10027341_46160 [Spirosoma knui]